ncbi:hypothetical protein ACB272_11035 [Klebsiella pneumoniae]
MAGVSTPALAAAVSNAGALGSLPGLGASTVAQAEAMMVSHPPADGPSVQCQSVLPCAAPGATPGGKPTGQQRYVPILPAMAVRHRIR